MNFFLEKEQKKKQIFIYSSDYLKSIFHKYEIEHYYTENDKLEHSLDSEICEEDILNIFKNEEILNIHKIMSSRDRLLEIFEERHPEKFDLISDISLNAEYYYKNKGREILNQNIFFKYENLVEDFLSKENINILYLINF